MFRALRQSVAPAQPRQPVRGADLQRQEALGRLFAQAIVIVESHLCRYRSLPESFKELTVGRGDFAPSDKGLSSASVTRQCSSALAAYLRTIVSDSAMASAISLY